MKLNKMVKLFTKKKLEETFTNKELKTMSACDWRRLESICNKYKHDYEALMKIVSLRGQALQFLKDSLKDDKKIVLHAVSETFYYNRHFEDGRCLKYASTSLKKDRDVVNAAILSTPRALEFADKKFKMNKKLVLKLISSTDYLVKEGGYTLEFADSKLKKDREVVLAAVRSNGRALQFADDKFKKDKEVVTAAVKQDSSALKYADKSFHNNLKLLSGKKYLFELERRLKK
tara:strand:+ start:237 stop:929 length:693 start_codon:yes stop_codon:yes gene_type:complete